MRTTLAKIPTRTDYVEEVYKVLLNAISDGTLAPGVRITQEEIAEQLDVSRSPVLQALRLLKKDGFIQDAPGRGVQVAPLDTEWIAKIYEVRGALDALAAQLAARRRARIDPALLENGRRIAHDDDVNAMIDADMAFHSAIYQAAGNDLIAQSAQLHWAHLRRVMGAVLQTSSQRSTVWQEHQAIAEAIASGDADKAALMVDEHTRRASANLTARLRESLRTDAVAQAAASAKAA
ncbi:MAG: GntR family transcriptional regulator [Burkholderiales bacterium]|nr:GntR family transcriptional regulator [Burkholderiales bacterium]